jgi:hypothetical protein
LYHVLPFQSRQHAQRRDYRDAIRMLKKMTLGRLFALLTVAWQARASPTLVLSKVWSELAMWIVDKSVKLC